MIRFVERIRVYLGKKRGASMVEYGLLVALIAIAVITAATTLGGKVKTTFTGAAAALK